MSEYIHPAQMFCSKCKCNVDVVASVCGFVRVQVPVEAIGESTVHQWEGTVVDGEFSYVCASCGTMLAKSLLEVDEKRDRSEDMK